MMAKAAFMMGIKTVVVAHSPHHVHILQDALKSYVRENMAADLPHFTPHDRTERLQEVKPVRLAMWEKQGGLKAKKCSADQPQEPDVKRARLSMDWETQLDSLGGDWPARPGQGGRGKGRRPGQGSRHTAARTDVAGQVSSQSGRRSFARHPSRPPTIGGLAGSASHSPGHCSAPTCSDRGRSAGVRACSALGAVGMRRRAGSHVLALCCPPCLGFLLLHQHA